LLVLTARAKLKKMPKAFLLLTGASAVGLPVFAVLHNLVYALFIYFFGEGFWGGIGDEPVFFILAVIVSPIAFLVGAIGSIVLKFWKVKKSPPRRRKR
jgi:ABC-type multidrug transport system permease subunit